MKVSKLFIWVFAIAAALCFALAPVSAGDHPWNEDEQSGGSGDGGEPDNGDSSPGDPNTEDPDDLDELFGTSFWWLGIIWDGVTGDEETDAVPSQSIAADSGPFSNNETGGFVN